MMATTSTMSIPCCLSWNPSSPYVLIHSITIHDGDNESNKTTSLQITYSQPGGDTTSSSSSSSSSPTKKATSSNNSDIELLLSLLDIREEFSANSSIINPKQAMVLSDKYLIVLRDYLEGQMSLQHTQKNEQE